MADEPPIGSSALIMKNKWQGRKGKHLGEGYHFHTRKLIVHKNTITSFVITTLQIGYRLREVK